LSSYDSNYIKNVVKSTLQQDLLISGKSVTNSNILPDQPKLNLQGTNATNLILQELNIPITKINISIISNLLELGQTVSKDNVQFINDY